jgi:small basic protein
MIWFTWRQFRIQTWFTVGILAVVGVLLALTGRDIVDAYTDANVAACHSDCAGAISSFLFQARNGTTGIAYNLANALMYVLPALIGIFWGAPLIARELEAGTHRLAWNQSVTRTRWLATKLAIVGAAAAASTGLLSWAVTSWAHHIDHAANNRITPMLFGARGIVPVGYALFALALGVTLGMLIRRTVPAMAATLGIYVAAVASVPLGIRAHLLPATHTTTPLNTESLTEFSMNRNGEMRLFGANPFPGSWELSNQTVTPAGQLFTGPSNPQYCGPEHGPQACLHWAGTLGLRQDLVYQPASHFWPLQWTETGVFVAVAALLAGFCFWWTRRRLT